MAPEDKTRSIHHLRMWVNKKSLIYWVPLEKCRLGKTKKGKKRKWRPYRIFILTDLNEVSYKSIVTSFYTFSNTYNSY